jgi:hypothetical protein
MRVSRDTVQRYLQHRSGTHNAGVLAETLAGSDGTPTHCEPSASEGAEKRVQIGTQTARLAGPSEGQRSSAVEHPTHNGKVAGAAPAAGIVRPRCARCDAVRYFEVGKVPKFDVCAPCRGRKKPRAFTKAPHARTRKHGERWLDHRGYVRVRTGIGKGAWAYEHRVVMAQMLGRELLPTEDVHHINEDKQDNRPENLEVVSRSVHTAHHNRVSPKRQKQGRAA